MKGNKSVMKLGGVASFLMFVCFVWIGIAIMFDPVERYRGEDFWRTAAEQPGLQISWRVAFFFVGILALAVIPATVDYIRPKNGEAEGFLRWTTLLAYIGSASLAIDSMRGIYLTLEHLTTSYEIGDRAYQLAVQVALSGGTDSQGFFQYGGVGLWYLTIGIVALNAKSLPKFLSFLFIAGGIGYFSTLVFGLTDTFIPGTLIAMQAIAAMLSGAVIGPLLHIWLGILLWRAGEEETAVSATPAEVIG